MHIHGRHVICSITVFSNYLFYQPRNFRLAETNASGIFVAQITPEYLLVERELLYLWVIKLALITTYGSWPNTCEVQYAAILAPWKLESTEPTNKLANLSPLLHHKKADMTPAKKSPHRSSRPREIYSWYRVIPARWFSKTCIFHNFIRLTCTRKETLPNTMTPVWSLKSILYTLL